MNADFVMRMPNPKIRVLNTRVIRIQIDDLVGFVDSQHLVDPKILQLQVAYDSETTGSINSLKSTIKTHGNAQIDPLN